MAKLPTRDVLGGLPSVPNTPIARYDTTAIGEGAAQAGRGLMQVGAALEARAKHQEQLDEYDTELKFQQFKWDQELARDEAQESVEPGQAGRFAEDWATGYRKSADEFLAGVPGSVRDKYGVKLKIAERELYRPAATFARTEQKRASITGLDEFKDRTLPKISTPEAFDRFKADYERQVRANPWLSPIEKDKVLRERLAGIEEEYGQKVLLDRGNARGLLRDLGMEETEAASPLDTDVNPEVRAKPFSAAAYEAPPKAEGLVEPGNIDLDKRKVLRMPDGAIKTEESMSIGTDRGEVLIPTVVDGKKLSEKEAIAHFDKTGQHLGIFKTPEAADAYAQALHERQGRYYGKQGGTKRESPGLFSPRVNDAITAAAEKHGVDPGLLATFARIESGGRPGAETGSYKGLFQLSSAEFRKHGGKGDVFDPGANADAAAAKLKAEAAEFEGRYGRAPTPFDLYMIHQQGEGGYAAHTANPDAPAWQNMASTGEGREKGARWAKQAIWGNIPDDVKARFPGGVESVSSADFMAVWQEKVDRFSGGEGGEPQPTVSGPYRNLTVDQRLRLASAARTALRQEAAEVAQDVKSFENVAEQGFALKPGQIEALGERVQRGGDAETRQRFREAAATLTWQDGARKATPEELDAFVRAETERLRQGGATPFEVKRLDMADKLLSTMRRELKSDPLGWADRVGLIQVQPIDFSNPDAAKETLGARVRQAQAVAQRYGVAPKYLRDDEQRTLTAAIEQGGDTALSAAGTIAAAAGPDSRAILSEISKNAPTAAIIGGMVAETGLSTASRDAAEGIALRKEPGFESVAPPRKEARRQITDTLGSALSGMPQAETAITDAANAVYEVRARKQQLTEFDAATWQQGLREVLGERTIDGHLYGGIVDADPGFGGRQIIIPSYLSQEHWRDAVEAITLQDLWQSGAGVPSGGDGRMIPMNRVKAAILVQAGDGRYRLSLGDPDLPGGERWIVRQDAPDQPFEIDMHRLRPLLAARRPDLFSGGLFSGMPEERRPAPDTMQGFQAEE